MDNNYSNNIANVSNHSQNYKNERFQKLSEKLTQIQNAEIQNNVSGNKFNTLTKII
jgi:hypothetical protein